MIASSHGGRRNWNWYWNATSLLMKPPPCFIVQKTSPTNQAEIEKWWQNFFRTFAIFSEISKEKFNFLHQWQLPRYLHKRDVCKLVLTDCGVARFGISHNKGLRWALALGGVDTTTWSSKSQLKLTHPNCNKDMAVQHLGGNSPPSKTTSTPQM